MTARADASDDDRLPAVVEGLTTSIPRAGVALLSMDRPDQLNAMSTTFFAGLPELLAALASRVDVRALVVTGAGGNFSSGGDMATFEQLTTEEDRRRHMERAFAALSALAAFPKPVVAAVEGIAYAGGMEVAAACDLVIAGAGARFCLPEVRIGLLPAFGLRQLMNSIGTQRARWLALTGQPIDAATAGQWGLVHEVVADGRALEVALDLATHLAEQPPPALAAIKAFCSAADPSLADGIDANVRLFGTAAHHEAVAAFRARRRTP